MDVSVDVGGTFTDLVSWNGADLQITKTDTTKHDLADGVTGGLRKLVGEPSGVRFLFHGTTAVINALLEERGARTALCTTRGFRDVYEIARGSRPAPYRLDFDRSAPLVRRRHRFELDEEMSARGESLRPPTAEQLREVVKQIRAADVEAVAVCLINSYANGEHERLAVEALRESLPGLHVCASHELVREWREFERTSTTVMNAYVAPTMQRYVDRLADRLRSTGFGGNLLFMQSTGGSISPATAKTMPVALVESGPASGMFGAGHLSRLTDDRRAVAFDMGGTTAKACLVVDHAVKTTRPYWVGGRAAGRPSLFPVVDLIEIGSGGGSIASVTPAGGLTVGPRSAGAFPGPVAYRRGGTEVTVTDANLVLGRLSGASFLGGELELDLDASREAVSERIARPLGMSLEDAASGIVEIVDDSMALAVRQVSIERGENPAELTMIAFGGGGPGHACSVAGQLGIGRVVVPPAPENFSAFGMLLSDVQRRATRTAIRPLSEVRAHKLIERFRALEHEAGEQLALEFPGAGDTRFEWTAELRYVGQEHTLPVAVDPAAGPDVVARLTAGYVAGHRRAYGFAVADEPIQLVTISVTGHAELASPTIADLASANVQVASGAEAPVLLEREVYLPREGWMRTPVVTRAELTPTAGPLIVQDYGATTLVPPGCLARRDEHSNIVIEVR